MNKVGELELIRESLVAVVNEMRANVIHASFSSIIYEGHDFSCGLLTREGQLLAQSLDDNPIHIFAVPYSAREVIARYGGRIADGDAFLHNDPYSGGTHLNDILLLEPIFAEGHLIAFAAVRCHWGDVGGMTAGSISGRATEIFQEGVRIPPIRIATGGEVNVELTDLLFANMRVPAERRGDFNTMIGASRKAIEHARRLVRRFGRATLLSGIDTLLRNAELVMREKIRGCTPGVYCSEGYVENNGHTDTPLAARLRLTVQDGAVDVDFWDASPQTAGPTNVGPAMAINSAGTILKAFLDPDSPMNHGSFRPIAVHAPEGSFINARPPVACGGSVEVKALLDAIIAGALGQAVPEKMVGDLKGGGNHVYISGSPATTRERRFFLFYEYPAAGTGATRRGDGSHATRTYTEGDFNSIGSAEVIESEMPLRVECTAIRAGSHGHGEHRGGCGMTRDIRILDTGARLSVLSDKNIIPPYGVAGAHSGMGNRFIVLRGDEVIHPSPLPGKVADFHLRVNDVVRMETAGGGGYGNPLQRDRARIAEDVRLGYTSRDDAHREYGVVINDAGEVDELATQARRKMLGEARVFLNVAHDATDRIDNDRRRFSVTQAVADALGVANGALCELVNPRGPSLRGWVHVEQNSSDDRKLALGPFARSILKAVPGDRMEIRPVRGLTAQPMPALRAQDARTGGQAALRGADATSLTLAELLVERWHDLPAKRIPDAIYERTALCFLDTIGVALAAVACDVGVAGLEIARESPRGPATVWGTDFGASAGEAAFANGMLAHAMDYDDLHPAAIMHSSAVVVPTAVAMGERVGASGRDMLAAAIVGYEMAAALGRLAPGAFQQHGFQSTAVLGTFAATAIAARLLKLSKHQAVHALGIAGSMASGLMEYLSDGSDVKQMHPGWAAHSGIRAAQLASRGFTGPSSVFEGRFGIYQAFARMRVRPEDARERSDGWEVEEMAPKPYPACLCVHPQVQAVLELRTRGAVTADAAAQIADIRCDVPSFYVGLVYEPTARKALVSTAYEARFSAPYCIARALLDGRLDLDSFDPDKLRDPKALAIAGKVTYRVEALPEFPESFPARVTVTMADGVQHKSYVGHNLGSARNPLTSSQLEAKFEACAVRTLGSAGAHALAVAIRKLPTPDSEKRAFRSALRGTLTAN